MHDHDDVVVIPLLRAIHAALPDQGTVLIAEQLSGVPGAAAITDAYLAFYLQAMGSGTPRNFARMQNLLEMAGFAEVRLRPVPMPLVASVITAIKRPMC